MLYPIELGVQVVLHYRLTAFCKPCILADLLPTLLPVLLVLQCRQLKIAAADSLSTAATVPKLLTAKVP
jgi:hypothetical protein